ncbi:MAG: hypothetical protein WA840_16435, partial [Caulobacteraceae bacterium]
MQAARHLQDDRWTLLAIGCLAALASAAGHEAVGHGLTCIAVGGRIALLTTTHFQCAGGAPLVDAAGPGMNLLLAALGAFGFRFARPSTPWLRLFFLALAAFNTFWFAGEALRSSLTHVDDEAALARTLGWPPAWRPACFAVAIGLYWWAVAYFAPPLREVSAGRGKAGALSLAAMVLLGGALALT